MEKALTELPEVGVTFTHQLVKLHPLHVNEKNIFLSSGVLETSTVALLAVAIVALLINPYEACLASPRAPSC